MSVIQNLAFSLLNSFRILELKSALSRASKIAYISCRIVLDEILSTNLFSFALTSLSSIFAIFSQSNCSEQVWTKDVEPVIKKVLSKLSEWKQDDLNCVFVFFLELSGVIGGVELLIKEKVLEAFCVLNQSLTNNLWISVVDYADLFLLAGNMVKYILDHNISWENSLSKSLSSEVLQLLMVHRESILKSLLLSNSTAESIDVSLEAISRASSASFLLRQISRSNFPTLGCWNKNMSIFNEIVRDHVLLFCRLVMQSDRIHDNNLIKHSITVQATYELSAIRRSSQSGLSFDRWINSLSCPDTYNVS